VRRVAAGLELGARTEDALEAMRARIRSHSIDTIVGAALLQRRADENGNEGAADAGRYLTPVLLGWAVLSIIIGYHYREHPNYPGATLVVTMLFPLLLLPSQLDVFADPLLSKHKYSIAALALELVGERWSLLIVRELLLGPQRFSELRRVLANTSSNVIADRLRELEANGVIRRRRLPAPAASWVYELTTWGRQLEPALLALGLWGLRSPLPPEPAVIGPTTVLLYLRTRSRPDPAELR